MKPSNVLRRTAERMLRHGWSEARLNELWARVHVTRERIGNAFGSFRDRPGESFNAYLARKDGRKRAQDALARASKAIRVLTANERALSRMGGPRRLLASSWSAL